MLCDEFIANLTKKKSSFSDAEKAHYHACTDCKNAYTIYHQVEKNLQTITPLPKRKQIWKSIESKWDAEPIQTGNTFPFLTNKKANHLLSNTNQTKTWGTIIAVAAAAALLIASFLWMIPRLTTSSEEQTQPSSLVMQTDPSVSADEINAYIGSLAEFANDPYLDDQDSTLYVHNTIEQDTMWDSLDQPIILFKEGDL